MNNDLTPDLLLLYYLLHYEEKRREYLFLTKQTNSAALKLRSTKIDNLFYYSNEIYDQIEIKYLLLKAKEPDYCIIYPSLMRLIINQFPQLCQVEHYLYDEQSTKLKTKNFKYFVELIDNHKHVRILTRSQFKKIKSYWFYGYSIHGSK